MQARSLLLPASLLVAWSVSIGCSSSTDPGTSPGNNTTPGGSHTPDGGATGTDGGSVNPGADGGVGPGTDGGSITSCPPSWTTTPECGGGSGGADPDFGPNVFVFDPSMGGSIQNKLDDIYGQQDDAQFGSGRYAFLFKPGKYNVDAKIGFYTELLGLGQSPDDVDITGAVRAKADWLGNQNATCNFWRGAENFSVTPTGNIDNNVNRWAVSQGTHLRRIHVKGDLSLDDGGWSSGGFVADSVIDGTINSGTQQQFLTRNNDQNWQGSNWNMVFVGDGSAPDANWPNPPYTVVDKTPAVREKPFLYLGSDGKYLVMVPQLKTASQGHSWDGNKAPGAPLSIDRFYITKPDNDDAASLNAALDQGKHLLFTPGIYHLKSTLNVTHPGTVLLGLGLATLSADSANTLVSVADVDGVSIAGILFEAGAKSGGNVSTTLLEVGPQGSGADHSANPTALFDVHCRVGGQITGTTKACVTVNSNNVIGDNMWLWRADHGNGADWNENKSDNGIIVNGKDVTIYALFSEHFQQYQTLWNGEGGSVYFYQSEMPYDPPNQSSWMAAPGHNGYPSYKVADGVKTHHAEGIGVYSVFSNNVSAENGIEGPDAPGVSLHHMVIVSLGSGTISHIVNDQGDTVGNGNMTSFSSD